MTPSQPLLDVHRRAEFRTSQIRLRPARALDQELMFGWRSDQYTARYLSSAAPQSIEQQRAWFERVCKDTSYSYHIVEYQRVPVGFTSMFNADPTQPEAEWGLVVGERREPGDVRVIAPLCCLCAFKWAGLQAIYTPINEKNGGAIRRVEQLGAKLMEGPSVYRKQGELLLRISLEDFNARLLVLADSNPLLKDALDVEMRIVETVE